MALNKSNKSTPSSRSGFFCDLSASTGKQNKFLFPVRIKITPNSRVGSFSDGKKNHLKMLQPVLIKDLLQSNHKEKQHSKLISVSTQKKKSLSQTSMQSMSRQSYYKTKKEGEELSLFKSQNGNKVRRQLYQTLECPRKSVFDGKENTNTFSKTKKKIVQNSEEQCNQSVLTEKNNRQSLLLPLNTIKNNFIRKSTSSKVNINKQNVKTNATSVNKQMKDPANITEIKELKSNSQERIYTNKEDEENMEFDFSSHISMKDNCTMTSPSIDKIISQNTNLSSITEFDKKLHITNSSKLKHEENQSNNPNLSHLETENLKNENPNICSKIVYNQPIQNTQFNFINVNNLDCSSFSQLKLLLEESIQACENQTFKLKQTLNFVNNILNNQTKINDQSNVNFNINEKSNTSIELLYNQISSNVKTMDGNAETKHLTNLNKSITTTDNVCTQESDLEDEENLSTSIQILLSKDKLNKSRKNSEVTIDETRLSTISETSTEVDELKNEDDLQEQKTIDNFISIIGSKNAPNIFYEDSFTLLENELNVNHHILPSKSAPASPIKYSTIPTVSKQWDKKVERPLKEYMNLKMNGTFLVTPDVKRFQSCLESTDTPHSRKSLSRKIFMELCDLYAESPESS